MDLSEPLFYSVSWYYDMVFDASREIICSDRSKDALFEELFGDPEFLEVTGSYVVCVLLGVMSNKTTGSVY